MLSIHVVINSDYYRSKYEYTFIFVRENQGIYNNFQIYQYMFDKLASMEN